MNKRRKRREAALREREAFWKLSVRERMIGDLVFLRTPPANFGFLGFTVLERQLKDAVNYLTDTSTVLRARVNGT
jgi:hypothetical protein